MSGDGPDLGFLHLADLAALGGGKPIAKRISEMPRHELEQALFSALFLFGEIGGGVHRCAHVFRRLQEGAPIDEIPELRQEQPA